MRYTVIPLLLLSAFLFVDQTNAFAVQRDALNKKAQRPNAIRRTDAKTEQLVNRENQQVARNPDTGPTAKHRTNREEVPGKRSETVWFQPPAHKPKAEDGKDEKASGRRKWAFGRVSWW